MVPNQRIPPIVLDMFSHIFLNSNRRDWMLAEEYILHKAYLKPYKLKHISKRTPNICTAIEHEFRRTENS